MANVLVRHCTFRVIRRGGWNWGPQPRALLERVLRRLPSLIAEQLDQLFDEDAEVEVTTPLRIAIPLSLGALRELGETSASTSSDRVDGLAAQLNEALRAALPPELTVETSYSRDRGEKQRSPRSDLLPAPVILPGQSPDPLSVLRGWLQRAELEQRLSQFSVSALRAWHDWIAGVPQAEEVNAQEIEGVEPVLGTLRARWAEPPFDEAELLVRRLIAFVAAEATVAGASASMRVRGAIERMLPASAAGSAVRLSVAGSFEGSEPSVEVGRQVRTGVAGTQPFRKKGTSHSTGVAQKDARLELQVESALPFLLLGPLARVGCLDVIAAAFEAAHAVQDLPLFGISLAYKVLAPPARGWLRSPATIASAAAFGLMPEMPPDAMLFTMVRRVDVSPLDAVIATTLLEGHQPGTPMLLAASGSRLALFDPDGAFPIGIASDIEPLLGNLSCLLHEIVLVPASAASPKVLAALDAAHISFLTDAPPSHGETWRLVRGRPAETWWSNDSLSAEERLAALGRRLTPASESAQDFSDAFSVRPSLLRSMHENYENTLVLVAGLALGSIAWNLWRDREPTAPQLALMRFQDLGARIRVDEASVRVSLPLGRRFGDLHDHGFLNDVSGVPWFGGRLLSFASG
jgi:hypothetical protein